MPATASRPSSDSAPPPRTRRGLIRALVIGLASGSMAFGAAAMFHRGRPAAQPVMSARPPGATLALNLSAGGAPLLAADVQVRVGPIQATAHTDASGVARLSGLPREQLPLVVIAPGYARESRSIDLRASDADLVLELQPGAELTGQVLDERERPIEGADVLVRVLRAGQASGEVWSARSAADGGFVVHALPRAHVSVDVSDGGAHEPASLADLSLPSAERVRMLLRRTTEIRGKVSGPDGRPLRAAQVTVAGSGVWPARSTPSDAAGAFRFEHIPEGVYELRAERGDLVSNPLEGVQIDAGAAFSVELELQRGAALVGQVRDTATGRAIAGAEIEVVEEALSATPKKTRSGARGEFELRGLRAQPEHIRVRADGYVTRRDWVTPGAAAYSALLLRAVHVRGVIEDGSGRPVANADLEVSGKAVTGERVRMLGPVQAFAARVANERESSGADDLSNLGVTSGPLPPIPLAPRGIARADAAAVLGEGGFHSDANGAFELEGLPPGELVITASHAGYGSARSATLQTRPGQRLDDVRIVLPRGTLLTGRVLDADGQPIARVRVDWNAPSEPARSTVTAEDGSFQFAGVRGDCTLWARPLGAPAVRRPVSERELGAPIDVTLESATAKLTGRVVDTDDQPIEGANIRLEAGKTHAFVATGLSGSDGRFALDALPPPPYVLHVEHIDYAPSAAIPIADLGSRPLVVRLSEGAGFNGDIYRARSSEPIPGARVTLQIGTWSRSQRADRQGHFAFQHVPSGSYRLTADADGFVSEASQGAFDGERTGDANLRVSLFMAGSISGDLVDRVGATVWNAEVAAGSPPDWSHAARTDHAGHFVLGQLRPGEHVVTARKGQQLVSSNGTVKVIEGEETPGLVLRLAQVVEDTAAWDAPVDVPERQAKHASAAPLVLAMRGDAVIVEGVAPGSAGARSGLQSGDVLVRVDGEPVRSAAQARGMLALPSGPLVRRLEVRRQGALRELRFGARPSYEP